MAKLILIDLYNVLVFSKENAPEYHPELANSPEVFIYNLDMLKVLADLGLDWYVFTAVDKVTLDYELMNLFKSYGCKDVFEAARLGLDKSTTYGYEFITKNKLGVKPSEVVYLDDTDKNVKAAINAGLQAEVYKDPKSAENWLKMAIAG